MPPKDWSFLTTLLRKCTSLREARPLHALLLTTGSNLSTQSPFLHNNILSLYARCGSFQESRQVFDEMPQRNIVSYNALISACSRRPHLAHFAFQLFDQLGREGHVANGLTVTSLLQAAGGLEDWILGCLMHAQCVKMGFLDNVRVQTSLLGMYCSCGDVESGRRVFFLMKDRDSTAWNAFISGCVKNGEFEEGIGLFEDMLRDGNVRPTCFTYSMVFNACAKLRECGYGRAVHGRVIVCGELVDMPLQNALLDMYCSCGDTCMGYSVFSRIENPDVVSWNSMIGGYGENGEGEKGMDMFVRLMKVSDVKPDEYTFAAVVSSAGGVAYGDCGRSVHAQIEKRGFSRSVYIGSTLISMYFRNDDFVSSQRIFGSFAYKDAVLWTDMIAGHVRIGESEAAMKLFYEMFDEGCELDSFALSSALSACADLAALRPGEMIHCLVLKTGNDSETCVHGSLVDMYAKNGELKSAAHVFSSLSKHDLKCWNSMLTGFGNHGKAKEAFQIFYAMLKHALRPDHVTFLSLLSTCGNCGLVNESRFFWDYMKENGLRPGPKHYSCMISLLSRAGLWEEAKKMIAESPFVDDHLESWRTILSSCLENGNLGLGIQAAEKISNITSEDSAANILITKLYAAVGRWEDVSEMRRKRRKLMLEKDPGLSWIEVQNNVHVFSRRSIAPRTCRDEVCPE